MVNPATLGFKTTEELHPITGLIGQDRALKAIQFGANIKSHDFNMFVLGPAGIRQEHGGQGPPGPEGRRVADARRLGLRLQFRKPQPAQGARAAARTRARMLAKGMVGGHRRAAGTCCRRCSRARTIRCGVAPSTSSSAPATRRRWRRSTRKAQDQNIAILRTPTGFTMAPMHEGKVVKPEVFNALPEGMRRDDRDPRSRRCRRSLSTILERLPKTDKQRRAQLKRAQRGGGQGRRRAMRSTT